MTSYPVRCFIQESRCNFAVHSGTFVKKFYSISTVDLSEPTILQPRVQITVFVISLWKRTKSEKRGQDLNKTLLFLSPGINTFLYKIKIAFREFRNWVVYVQRGGGRRLRFFDDPKMSQKHFHSVHKLELLRIL